MLHRHTGGAAGAGAAGEGGEGAAPRDAELDEYLARLDLAG